MDDINNMPMRYLRRMVAYYSTSFGGDLNSTKSAKNAHQTLIPFYVGIVLVAIVIICQFFSIKFEIGFASMLILYMIVSLSFALFKQNFANSIFTFLWSLIVPNYLAQASASFITGPLSIFLLAIFQLNFGHSKLSSCAILSINILVYKNYHLDMMLQKIQYMSFKAMEDMVLAAVNECFVIGAITSVSCIIIHMVLQHYIMRLENLESRHGKNVTDLTRRYDAVLENLESTTSSLVHRINNSLSAIIGNIDIAENASSIEDMLEQLTKISISANILKYQALDILDCCRISSNKLKIIPRGAEIKALATEIWGLASEVIRNKHLRTTLTIQQGIPEYLELDQERVVQCILELVSNAAKFTDVGEVAITIGWTTTSPNIDSDVGTRSMHESIQSLSSIHSCTGRKGYEQNQLDSPATDPDEDPLSATRGIGEVRFSQMMKSITGKTSLPISTTVARSAFKKYYKSVNGMLKISVVDTGIGMTDEQIERLFQDPPSLAGTSTCREIKKGAGLTLARKLALEMCGEISARSKLNQGSVFDLKICTKTLENSNLCSNILRSINLDQSFAHEDASKNCVAELRWPLKGGALLAEDDSINCEVLGRFLKRLDIEYDVVFDGRALVDKIKKSASQQYSVIITDNKMPRLSGIEAAKEVSDYLRSKGRPLIPIIIITGDQSLVGSQKDVEHGIIKHMQKPVRFNQLRNILKPNS